MKKVIFSIFAVAAIIMAALTINSCTKQEGNEPAIMQKEKGSQVSAEDRTILNNIINFRDKINYITENPGYKSGEEVEVDSTIWYLDATLNFSHAFISWTPMSNFYTDSVFVTIPKSGNTVDMDDLAAAYTELKQKVADVCIAAPGESKELYIASLTKKTETTGDVTVRAYTTIGSTTPPGDEEPFTYGWYYGDLAGDENGNFIGDEDACTQLAYFTNEFRDLYVDEENMIYIGTAGEDPYTTIKSENEIFVNPDDPIPYDNYYERFLVYQRQIWTYHDLLSVEEMNWYYHKLNYVIYDMVPNNQQEWPKAYHKTFMNVIEEGDPLNEEGTFGHKNESEKIIKHHYKVEYRKGIHIEDKTPESITGN